MKRKSSSSSRRQAGSSVALFPFLAVLVCTMGGLIVMMMIITRQAKQQAVATAQDQTAEKRENLQAQEEEARWRTEQLRDSRNKLGEDLLRARLQMGHLEEHAQQLRAELEQRKAEWNDLEQWEKREVRQREKMEADLARLRQEADAARREADAARLAAGQRTKAYSILPYEGPNGTRRRPIYIECRDDAVIIQPEGIHFTVHDFNGPQGPGNPLASAVRAMREYWVRQQAIHPDTDGEPYPLLLVRPEGVIAYYAARSALESYESDFGYELLGEDWKLKFPTADPMLTQVLQSTVANARQVHERLIAAAPRTYGDARPRGRYPGGPLGGTGGAGLAAGSLGGGSGAYQPSGDSFREMLPDDVIADPNRPGTYGARGAASGSGDPGGPNAKAVARPEGFVAGQARESNDAAKAGEGSPLRPGEWIPPEERAKKAQRDAGSEAAAKKRLADTRGRDWGLPKRGSRSVPMTRPIRIECYADRLVVLPEPGLPGQRVIRLGPRTGDSVDELVSSIWEEIDSWGIAGRDMYWRPLLRVAVAPDAEARFRDLLVLLDGSGLEVERR